jgi:hypothetical protein
MEERWECEVAGEAEEHPSLYEEYDVAEEGGSDAELVLMRRRLLVRRLMDASCLDRLRMTSDFVEMGQTEP